MACGARGLVLANAAHRLQPALPTTPSRAPAAAPCPRRSSLTHLVLPVALTHLPELVPGQLPCLASLDLTHSIVEALPPSWCCHLQVGVRGVAGGWQAAGPGQRERLL